VELGKTAMETYRILKSAFGKETLSAALEHLSGVLDL
jgi:hypothetical protein